MPAPLRLAAALAAVAAASAPALAGDAPPPTAPMTFAEVLQDQRLPALARFAPDGDALLVATVRHDRPSGGAPWRLTGTETVVWDLDARQARPVGGPGAAFQPSPCEPWSPSGRFLAGFVLQGGEKRLAAWDRRDGRLAVFAVPPTVQCPRWAGERLVYPAALPGAPTLGGSSGLAVAAALRRWRAAWAGGEPQVTVHSNNPAFPAPEADTAAGGLALADPATGRAELAARGRFHSVTPAPGGAWVAVVREGTLDAGALGVRSARPGVVEVHAVTAEGLRRVQAAHGFDADYAGLAWSPDAARLLATGRPADGARPALLLVQPAGGAEVLRLPPGLELARNRPGAYSQLLPAGWIGADPTVLAGRTGDRAQPAASGAQYAPPAAVRLYVLRRGRALPLTGFARQSVTAFASVPGAALVVADGALWRVAPGRRPQRVSAAGLEVAGLAPARPAMGLAPAWAVTPSRAAVLADGAGGTRLVVLDLATGRTVLEAGRDEALATDEALRSLIRSRRDGWSSTLELAGSRRGPLTTFNPGWRGRPTVEARPFAYSAAGRRLAGWVLLPPGHGGGPLPALVWLYGGQVQGATPPAEAQPGYDGPPVFSGQLWAARGYAVVYPSTPLAGGPDADAPAALAEATVAAVDAVAAQGLVDPARVGLLGHSFGGFAVAAVLSRRPDRFAAGAALSGAYDFAAAWGARGPREWMADSDGHDFRSETVGRVERGQIGLGAPPFAAPGAYRRASPFAAAPAIRTPLWLAAGDLEPAGTGLGQAERLYAALVRAGNPAVLVRYWGQGHVQDEPWAQADQWARLTAWFDRYCRGAAEPAGPPP
ncbi:MAG: prolyl oligopeptidase family serine peptidase [Pseudomonadota bacterium]